MTRGHANLDTLTFDKRGRVWFAGQNGVSGKRGANVRQILGRPGEVWAPESGSTRLVRYRTH